MNPKARRQSIQWEPIDAKSTEIDLKRWYIKTKSYSKDVMTVLYYCKNSKNGCNAKMRCVFNYETIEMIKGYYSDEHSDICEGNYKKEHTKAFDLKEKILEIKDTGFNRPRDIYNLLVKEGIDAPMKNIYNVISRVNVKIARSQSNFSISDLVELCQLSEYNNNEEAFILAFDTSPVKVLFTHKKLLESLYKSQNVHIDATYKLNIYGFPVIVVGISDLNRKFCCSAICIAQTEDSDTLSWILKKLLPNDKNVTTVPSKNFIGDCAKQITSAVQEYGNDSLRTCCWAHVNRLIDKSISKLLSIFKEDATEGIYFLQSLTSRELFEKGMSLFLKKYDSFRQTKSFCADFKTLYVDDNSTWYEAYDPHNPSTNNALERFNLTIKSKYLNWTKVDLAGFFEISCKILNDYSKMMPSLDKILYTKDELTAEGYSFTEIRNSNGKIFLLVTKRDIEPTDTVKSLFYSEFETFDCFYDFYSSLTFLTTSSQVKTWKDIICSCTHFAKKKKCDHVFAYLKETKKTSLVEIPLINLKSKRGRKPKNIKKKSALNFE